ncbi:hypothetical protein BGX34_004776 [Mortierella sp. NVP85]|nr:hypothetical protein BGX34_004776 [Mortierella sp. NVP85]
MLTTLPPKLRAWFASLTSPSATHASGMLILLGILVAVTEAHSAQGQDEPIRMHHPKVSRSPSQPGDEDTEGLSGAEVEPMSNQEMLKYVAMGMVVSQTLIRLLQYISNRRDAAAAAARKRDEDSQTAPRRSKRAGGLTFNALEGLDEEEQRKRRAEHLAALGDKADLLPSDSDDDDYEESDSGSSESDDESEGVESEDEEERMDETMGNDNEGEPRRRVLYAGEEIEG